MPFRSLFRIFFLTLFFSQNVYSCDEWFNSLKIKDSNSCEEKCRLGNTDMATYLCPQQCDVLCKNFNKPPEKDINFYDLTDSEVIFCKKNPISCAKSYKLSWDAEKLCLSVYPRSGTNDESDACRHYIWSLLLSKEFGAKTAREVLNAHENNPKQDLKEKEMDLKNNEQGLSDFQKNPKISSDKFIDLYKKSLKNNKLKIIKPKYSSKGGLP